MKNWVKAGALLIGLLGCADLAKSQPTASAPVHVASVQALPFMGVALALNDRGDVVGHSNFSAFLWTEDWGNVPLGTLPGQPLCQATAVNNKREVVGWCWGQSTTESRAFLWTPEHGMRDIGRGVAMDINDAGEVAGGGNATDELQESWRWVNGQRQLLGLSGQQSMAMALNEWGHVVASGSSSEDLRCFVWREESGLEPLDARGICFDINERGEITTNAAASWNPQLLRPGQEALEIPMPAGSYGAARALNNMRVVVGNATDNNSEESSAFIWTAVSGYMQIGWAQTAAEKINESGEIAGSLIGNDGLTHPAIWRLRTPVDVRLKGAALVLRAHIERGLVEQGPGTSVVRAMDRIALTGRGGAGTGDLTHMLQGLSGHLHGLLTAGRLPPFEVWLLRSVGFALADLDSGY